MWQNSVKKVQLGPCWPLVSPLEIKEQREFIFVFVFSKRCAGVQTEKQRCEKCLREGEKKTKHISVSYVSDDTLACLSKSQY